MIDLFGLHKEMDPHDSADTPPRPNPSGSTQRIWAVLLALDTVLIVGFAGGLARLSWMRRPQPIQAVQASALKSSRALPKPSKAPAPEPPAPKSETFAKAPSVPAKKAAPAPNPKPASERPVGSPTVSAPDLPQHAAAPVGAPTETGKSSAAPSSGAKPKAVPTQFSCYSPSAGSVRLRGPFLVKTGGYKPMVRGDDGAWRLTVSLLPGTYKYFCVVDGKRSKIHSITVP